MADRGLRERRREPVDRTAQRSGRDTDLPPPQYPEQGHRRTRESCRRQNGQADLRPGNPGHRSENHSWQQQRSVPHQVDARRCVQRGRHQRWQPAVPDRCRRLLHEPGGLIGVVRITGHQARCRIAPQVPGQRHCSGQVAQRFHRGRSAPDPRGMRGNGPVAAASAGSIAAGEFMGNDVTASAISREASRAVRGSPVDRSEVAGLAAWPGEELTVPAVDDCWIKPG